jgi:two-component system NtrC family sensor kinase
LAALLGVALVAWVVNPVRRLQAGVKRIAGGDLATPLPPSGGTGELADLAVDVERMRDQLRVATTGLEGEVARKTEHLSVALAERTRALEELDATKDRLVQSAKMAGLGTLAGGVAHEFNNLLGGILASLNNARAAVKDPSVEEDLELAARTARRAATLVQALLGVARPGQRTLKPVDLGAVVADALEAARPAAEKRRVTLQHRREGSPVVQGDDGQLHQVALNLVTNALQAVKDGGRVTLLTGVRDRRAVLEVTDDGPGIRPEVKERLFEPFFTTREGGTGLGLFVSYGIVERHGGRIDVGSAGGTHTLQPGARFTVSLPLSAS